MALLYALAVALLVARRTDGRRRAGDRRCGPRSRLPRLRAALPPARERRAVRRRVRARRAAHGAARRGARRRGGPPRSASALALLVLIRPVSLVLVVLAPLAAPRPGRVASRGSVGSARSAPRRPCPLLVWAGHNAVRADDFTVVRGAGHGLPLYRAFVVDRIVSPENGEASRELARAVADDLLPREPYRSYEIDLDTFFGSRKRADARGPHRPRRPHVGLGRRLRAPRARRARGGARASRDVRARRRARLLAPALVARLPARRPRARLSRRVRRLASCRRSCPSRARASRSRRRACRRSSRRPTAASARCGRRRPSTRSTPTIRATRAHLDRMNRRVDGALRGVLRPGRERGARPLDRPGVASGSRARPSGSSLGLVALAVRRPRRMATPLVLTAAALLVILGTSLAVPAAAEYSTPVAPAFLLLAAAGLLAPRRTA